MTDEKRREAVDKAERELLNLKAGLLANGSPGKDPKPETGP